MLFLSDLIIRVNVLSGFEVQLSFHLSTLKLINSPSIHPTSGDSTVGHGGRQHALHAELEDDEVGAVDGGQLLHL